LTFVSLNTVFGVGPDATCWYWPLGLIEATWAPETWTLALRRMSGGWPVRFSGVCTSFVLIGPETTVTAWPGSQVRAAWGVRYFRANA
jgi:hypothetical protein